MEYIIGIVVLILLIGIIMIILKGMYDRDIGDLEERILQLEKRIEEVKSVDRKRGQILDEAIGERIKESCELENRIQKLERKKKSDKND